MQVHLLLLATLPLGYALSVNETCSAEDAQICGRCINVLCGEQKYNLIGSFTSVSSTAECHEWCNKRNEYMNDCKYLTYYGKGGLPFENICYIFRSCEKKIEGTGCVTEATDCYHVPTSIATTPAMTTTTTTSPKTCAMHINGMQVQYHKFEYSGNEETFQISGNPGCQVRVLAVGGGGLRGTMPNLDGVSQLAGAGSGYITNATIKFPQKKFEVSLRVGGPGEVSTVKTAPTCMIAIALRAIEPI